MTADSKKLYGIAFYLAVLTIIASTLEGSFSVYFGYESRSLTLFGNGLASFIGVISGSGILVMTFHRRKESSDPSKDFEQIALRITAIGLYLLAAGLLIVGILNILSHQHPTSTRSGIIIAIVTIAMIGALVFGKMKVAKNLHSSALLADAKCTRICVYMSTMVLIASVLFELTKFPYADSLGAIGVAYFSYSEAKSCSA